MRTRISILQTLTAIFVALFLRASVAENKPMLQASTYRILTEVQTLMDKSEYAAAKTKLQKLLGRKPLKSYDQAVILQTLGYVENGLGRFSAAAAAFERAVKPEVLPAAVQQQLYYSTAQLLIHLKQPEKGLVYLGRWFTQASSPTAEAHILAASAHYQRNDFKQIIIHVEKALTLSGNPPFNWYELLLAACYETKSYPRATELLETIVVKFPEKQTYWIQLAGMYHELKQPRKALAVYELAHTHGQLNESDKIQLVKTYLYLQMPYKAGALLEQELATGGISDKRETLKLLADCWLLAHEHDKAASVLKKMVKRFDDGRSRLRLARIYYEQSSWQTMVELLDGHTGVSDKTLQCRLNLLLGIARYHTDDVINASASFNRALSDKATRVQADWWLNYMKKSQDS